MLTFVILTIPEVMMWPHLVTFLSVSGYPKKLKTDLDEILQLLVQGVNH